MENQSSQQQTQQNPQIPQNIPVPVNPASQPPKKLGWKDLINWLILIVSSISFGLMEFGSFFLADSGTNQAIQAANNGVGLSMLGLFVNQIIFFVIIAASLTILLKKEKAAVILSSLARLACYLSIFLLSMDISIIFTDWTPYLLLYSLIVLVVIIISFKKGNGKTLYEFAFDRYWTYLVLIPVTLLYIAAIVYADYQNNSTPAAYKQSNSAVLAANPDDFDCSPGRGPAVYLSIHNGTIMQVDTANGVSYANQLGTVDGNGDVTFTGGYYNKNIYLGCKNEQGESLADVYKNVSFQTAASTTVQNTATTTTPEPISKPYVDAVNGFSIIPPAGWTVDNSGAHNSAVNFVSGSSVVDVIVKTTTKDLADYTSAFVNPISFSPGYDLLGNDTFVLDGDEASEVRFSYPTQAGTMQVMVVIIVKDGKSYVIGGFAPEADWSTQGSAIEASLASFKLD